MTAIYDHADSLRRYLTGATSDGGAQASADASLGGYCSSTQIGGLVASIASPITGIIAPKNQNQPAPRYRYFRPSRITTKLAVRTNSAAAAVVRGGQ